MRHGLPTCLHYPMIQNRSHAPFLRAIACLALLALAACATPVKESVRATLNDPALAGTRWGLVVTTLEGKELVAINPDDRFVPASNTKLFTTLAVFRNFTGLDQPDTASATSLRIESELDGSTDIVLTGNGDATLGDGPQCQTNCLARLADAIVNYGFATIRDVIGDDRLFPDERWSPGWSWNNLETRSGTAISALTVNDNELALYVSPGAAAGDPAIAKFREADDLYDLVNEAVTVETGETDLYVEHRPNTPAARLYGQIALTDKEQVLAMGVDDPALQAATRLRRLLEKRGLTVTGDAIARRRPSTMADDPTKRPEGSPAPRPPAPTGTEIVRLQPGPLIDDLRFTLKVSQNLHAELVLRRLGLIEGAGSAAEGLAIVEKMLTEAGLPRSAWDLSDGSGMSTYNRITPRGMTKLLRWTQTQPWAADFRSALPGSGEGTLARRFRGTALDGKIFAKTGSLNAVNALSGFMTAASGRTLVFAAYANDRPSTADSATQAMDAALLQIAARH